MTKRASCTPPMRVYKNTPIEELMRLAALPVETGSGYEVYGRGPHMYIKGNTTDGSVRVLRFKSRDKCARATHIGIAADLADAA